MSTLKEIGEFALIERLARQVADRNPPSSPPGGADFPLLLGIGDDAAAWKADKSTVLFTTDTLVQDVHFTLATASWRDLGWKALAVNLSDIAAMGGSPLYSIVTLGLPGGTAVADIDELYRGLLDACEAYGGTVVGGDLVRSEVIFITIALTGVTRRTLLLRSVARPGDLVAVTGTLGNSAAGLRMLQQGLAFDSPTSRMLREAHLRPQPRLADGQALAQDGVLAAIDISDGLVDDLAKLCHASGVAARLFTDRLPIHPILEQAFPKEFLGLALSGGEDYELLLAAPPRVMATALPVLPAGGTMVGEIIAGRPGEVTVFDAMGQVIALPRGGWDHFRV